jgi:hypothetical protein
MPVSSQEVNHHAPPSLPAQITTAVPVCHHQITAPRQILHEFSRGGGAFAELQESGRAILRGERCRRAPRSIGSEGEVLKEG